MEQRRAGSAPASRRRRNAALLLVVGVVWLALDVATKLYFNGGAFAVGEAIGGPYLGLFGFTLVHNTGAAWGIFGDATTALGVVALVVAFALIAFVLVDRRATAGQTVGAALVAAGGIGNAIDRFLRGYVVDFIELSFIDFPVFNIADIGVTCGVVILVIAVLADVRGERS